MKNSEPLKAKAKPATVVAERLYVRVGKRTTSYSYKHPDGRNEQLASAPTRLHERVALAKAAALRQWADMRGQQLTQPDHTVAGLFADYFKWQAEMPAQSGLKKAASTITGNLSESKPLLAYFGHMQPDQITMPMVYDYADLRAAAGAPAGVIKEIALASGIFAYGQRRGRTQLNPFRQIKLAKPAPSSRRVEWHEIEAVTAMGREIGGTHHIQALAVRAAWLAFKRPGEVLRLTRDQINPQGIAFQASKRRAGQAKLTITIEWSPLLKATIDEATSLKRWSQFGGSKAIFGNLAGHPYTRSGWGKMWGQFMAKCERLAQERGQAFQRFTLLDCRAGGVTEKRATGQNDVYEGTGHVDHRMIDQVYDRRRDRVAKPAK